VGYRAVLRQVPQLRPLLTGYAVSSFGDAAQFSALLWLAARPPVDGLRVSLVVLATIAPGALIAPWTAAVGDTVQNRRDLLVAFDLIQAGLAIGLAVLETWAPLWALLSIIAAMSAIAATATATYSAALPEVVGAPHLGAVNGLYRSSAQLAGIAGAAAGGLMAASMPAPSTFALNSLTFLISAIALIRVSKLPFSVGRGSDQQNRVASSYLNSLREGWRFLRGSRPARALLVVGFLGTIGFSPAPVALVVLIRNVLHADGAVYGSAQGLIWTGLAFGGLVAGGLTSRRRTDLFGPAYLALALLTLGLGLSGVWWLALLCAFGRAAANGVTSLTSATLLQSEAPNRVRSGVVGTAYAIYEIPRMLLLPVSGTLIEAVGVRPVYAGMAVFITAAGVVALLRRKELSQIGLISEDSQTSSTTAGGVASREDAAKSEALSGLATSRSAAIPRGDAKR
jgi:DHA3 family macrolide efflux protein-like MFS transporter